MAVKKGEDKCAFCGKKRSEVTLLISDANQKVFICDKCVDEAKERIQEVKTVSLVHKVIEAYNSQRRI